MMISDNFLETFRSIRITTQSGSIYELQRDGVGGEIRVSKNGKLMEDLGCYEVHPGIWIDDIPTHVPASDKIAFCCTHPDMSPYTIITSPICKFELLEDDSAMPFSVCD